MLDHIDARYNLVARAVRSENRRQLWRAASVVSRLRRARILMTGCTGLFGLWLLDLVDLANEEFGAGIEIIALTRNSVLFADRCLRAATMPGLRLLQGDIRNIQIGEINPTHLIHAATTSAEETYNGASSAAKFDTLVNGTRNLLTQLADKPLLESALFLSSGAVYGPADTSTGAISETHAVAPLTSDIKSGLAQAKRAAEFLCHSFADDVGLTMRVARCFSFSGAGLPLNLHYALGDFVRQALAGDEIVVKGDGTAVRSYMHLGDMAIWLLGILSDTDQSRPTTVNVGSPCAMTIKELADTVAASFTPRKSVVVQGGSDYSVGNAVRSYYVPDTKLAAQFGLENWTCFQTSLANLIDGSHR